MIAEVEATSDTTASGNAYRAFTKNIVLEEQSAPAPALA
jgi:hypothetical protein